jgi:hypothetical protein
MTEDTRIDIGDLITQLCGRLNLGPKENVAEIHFEPGHVTATVYRLNDQGKKYVDPDTDRAVTDIRAFAVRT